MAEPAALIKAPLQLVFGRKGLPSNR